MIDKRVKSLAEAVSGIADGATILCAGFGGAGLPDALCEAVVEQGARDLTVVANNAGTGRRGLAALLAAGRVRRIICSFPRSSGSVVFEELYAAGRIELELVPQGIISERMQQVLTIRAERVPQMQREQEHARVYWQHRKIELGIHHAMPMAERLERIRESRAHAISHAPERPTLAQMREQTQTLERSVTSLERYVQRVERTQRQEHRLEQSHGPYEWRQMRDAEKVLADGVQHGLPRDVEAERLVAQLSRYLAAQEQEPQPGAALRVRIFGREHDRDEGLDRGQGMGF